MRWLKWQTLAPLAYVAVVFTLRLDWWQVAREVFRPRLVANHDMLLMVVAVFGITISPYLFFWQAAQEMEDMSDRPPHTRKGMRYHLRRVWRPKPRRVTLAVRYCMSDATRLRLFRHKTA